MGIFKKKHVNHPIFWENYASAFDRPLSEDLKKIRFVVLDTETTGFDYETDRMLSIGALAVTDNAIAAAESMEVFLNQYYYHSKNVAIHGILKKEQREVISELEAIQLLLAFLGNSVLVAHHAAFDLRMLNEALKRHGLPKLKNKVLDTATLYKKTLIRSPLLQRKEHYSLDDLADKFDISKKDRHTALGDAYITALAFIKILSRLQKKGVTTRKKLFK